MAYPEKGNSALLCVTNLQGSSHEYRTAHEQEDKQASKPLLSNA